MNLTAFIFSAIVLTWLARSNVSAIAAQDRTVIASAVSCPNCDIVFDTLTTIGGTRDGDKLHEATWIARDSRGQVYAMGLNFNVLVFDSSGVLVAEIGGRGQGPGEFRTTITRLQVGPGDSLYVQTGLRIHIFTPTHKFARVVQLPAQAQLVIARHDGTFLFGGMIQRPAQAGFPFHHLSASGQPIKSFGPEAEIRPGQARGGGSALFILSNSQREVWQWRPFEYRFVRWSIDGRKLSEIEITNDVPGWRGTGASPVQNMSVDAVAKARADIAAGRDPVPNAPGSQLMLLSSDASGRLWVSLFARPVPLIHVVDPVGGKVLVSKPYKGSLYPILGTGLLFTRTSTPYGQMTIAVLRLSVKGAFQ